MGVYIGEKQVEIYIGDYNILCIHAGNDTEVITTDNEDNEG